MNAANIRDVIDQYKFIDVESVDLIERLFESLAAEELPRETAEDISDEDPDDLLFAKNEKLQKPKLHIKFCPCIYSGMLSISLM